MPAPDPSQDQSVTNGADIDASAELESWVRAGRENQRSVSVIFHAQAFYRAGRRREDCPFGAQHPEARDHWLWMFDVCIKAAREREAKARAKAEAEGRLFPDPPATQRQTESATNRSTRSRSIRTAHAR